VSWLILNTEDEKIRYQVYGLGIAKILFTNGDNLCSSFVTVIIVACWLLSETEEGGGGEVEALVSE
jgi:hypothetical protein